MSKQLSDVSKNIKVLRWFNFFTDFGLYSPIAILYFANVSGSFTLGMSVFSVIMVSAALFEIPTGVFSDFIGRKNTVVLGAIASFLAVVFYAIGQAYWILLIGALFEGLSRSFYSGNNDALLYDTLLQMKKEDQFYDILGKLSSMFQIALAIAAVLGSFIASWSFSAVFWLQTIPQFICIILSFQLIEPALKKKNETTNIYSHLKESLTQFIKNRKLSYLSLTSMLSYGIGEASFYFQSAFIKTLWPVWAIGFAKTASYVGGAASYYFSGKIINKFEAIKVLLASNIYNRTVNIISLAFPNVFSPAIMSSTSLFYGASSVAKSALLQREFTLKQRATMGSLNSLGGNIVFGIYAVILGFIGDKLGANIALLVSNILLFSNLFLYLKIFKHDKALFSS